MRNEVIAERYAQALLSVAKDKNQAAAVLEQIRRYQTAVSTQPEMVHFLKSPRIPDVKKEGLIARIFEGESQKVLTHFVRLLLRKGRIGALEEIFRLYPKLYDAERGVLKGELTTAFPLDPDVVDRLRAKLEAEVHQKLELTVIEDLDIIGGFIFSTGTIMVDASVRGRLEDLKEQMKSAVIPLSVG